MIIEVDDAADERLNAFRWRERQLNTIAQRKAAQVNNLESTGMFIAEGDLVVRRALEAGCKPSVVLCGPKCAQEFVADVTKQGGITLPTALSFPSKLQSNFRLSRFQIKSLIRKSKP